MISLPTSVWNLHTEAAEETTTDSDRLKNATKCVCNICERVRNIAFLFLQKIVLAQNGLFFVKKGLSTISGTKLE